ncbi:MAG: SDR family oxidoreductase [Chlamydiales bacterium]
MGKTILITGCSTGIGRATVKYFQEKGWNVIATMRSPEKEKELTKLNHVLVTHLDVQKPSTINTAIKEGIEKFGKIDVVVNNAGYGSFGPLEVTPREKIIRQFEVNIFGLLDVTKAIIPHFRKNHDGIIINVSSVVGKLGMPLSTLYVGTKFAVEGLSESLHFEMEHIGCKVKIIEPGAIRTDFGGRSIDFNNDESLTEYQDAVGKLHATFKSMLEKGAEPILVAKTIYEAATDGTNRLRYPVGADAENLISKRKESNDEAFIAELKAMFGYEPSPMTSN